MPALTLRQMQTNLPWSVRYSEDFRSNPQSHKDFAHGVVHIGKANGRLLGLVDDMDHRKEVAANPELRNVYGKYLADVVISALRAANTFPGGVLDLHDAVVARLIEKNEGVSPIFTRT